MSYLKKENVKKCFSLLKEFVDESGVADNKKGTAILALEHLRKITAGGGDESGPQCIASPRADGVAAPAILEESGPQCIASPRADG